jgi:hypothetical protein
MVNFSAPFMDLQNIGRIFNRQPAANLKRSGNYNTRYIKKEEDASQIPKGITAT